MATVRTVSTRSTVADVVGQVRRAVARDGVAQLAARSSRQRNLLGRAAGVLAADPALNVTGGDHLDGYAYVTVFPAGSKPPGIWGQPAG